MSKTRTVLSERARSHKQSDMTLLLITQGFQRVNSRRTPRRKVACGRCHGTQRGSHPREGHGILRLDAIQHTGNIRSDRNALNGSRRPVGRSAAGPHTNWKEIVWPGVADPRGAMQSHNCRSSAAYRLSIHGSGVSFLVNFALFLSMMEPGEATATTQYGSSSQSAGGGQSYRTRILPDSLICITRLEVPYAPD